MSLTEKEQELYEKLIKDIPEITERIVKHIPIEKEKSGWSYSDRKKHVPNLITALEEYDQYRNAPEKEKKDYFCSDIEGDESLCELGRNMGKATCRCNFGKNAAGSGPGKGKCACSSIQSCKCEGSNKFLKPGQGKCFCKMGDIYLKYGLNKETKRLIDFCENHGISLNKCKRNKRDEILDKCEKAGLPRTIEECTREVLDNIKGPIDFGFIEEPAGESASFLQKYKLYLIIGAIGFVIFLIIIVLLIKNK